MFIYCHGFKSWIVSLLGKFDISFLLLVGVARVLRLVRYLFSAVFFVRRTLIN